MARQIENAARVERPTPNVEKVDKKIETFGPQEKPLVKIGADISSKRLDGTPIPERVVGKITISSGEQVIVNRKSGQGKEMTRTLSEAELTERTAVTEQVDQQQKMLEKTAQMAIRAAGLKGETASAVLTDFLQRSTDLLRQAITAEDADQAIDRILLEETERLKVGGLTNEIPQPSLQQLIEARAQARKKMQDRETVVQGSREWLRLLKYIEITNKQIAKKRLEMHPEATADQQLIMEDESAGYTDAKNPDASLLRVVQDMRVDQILSETLVTPETLNVLSSSEHRTLLTRTRKALLNRDIKRGSIAYQKLLNQIHALTRPTEVSKLPEISAPTESLIEISQEPNAYTDLINSGVITQAQELHSWQQSFEELKAIIKNDKDKILSLEAEGLPNSFSELMNIKDTRSWFGRSWLGKKLGIKSERAKMFDLLAQKHFELIGSTALAPKVKPERFVPELTERLEINLPVWSARFEQLAQTKKALLKPEMGRRLDQIAQAMKANNDILGFDDLLQAADRAVYSDDPSAKKDFLDKMMVLYDDYISRSAQQHGSLEKFTHADAEKLEIELPPTSWEKQFDKFDNYINEIGMEHWDTQRLNQLKNAMKKTGAEENFEELIVQAEKTADKKGNQKLVDGFIEHVNNLYYDYVGRAPKDKPPVKKFEGLEAGKTPSITPNLEVGSPEYEREQIVQQLTDLLYELKRQGVNPKTEGIPSDPEDLLDLSKAEYKKAANQIQNVYVRWIGSGKTGADKQLQGLKQRQTSITKKSSSSRGNITGI